MSPSRKTGQNEKSYLRQLCELPRDDNATGNEIRTLDCWWDAFLVEDSKHADNGKIVHDEGERKLINDESAMERKYDELGSDNS